MYLFIKSQQTADPVGVDGLIASLVFETRGIE